MGRVLLSGIKNIIFRWVFSPGVADIYRSARTINFRHRVLCRPNSRFKGIHQGERCFILCNGPSVKKQDLLPLKDEIVFSVSSGYHHKDYLAIQPKYHCVPRISFSKYLQPRDVIPWFKEMDEGIGTAELFFDAAEEPLIRENKLFGARRINYVYSGAYRSDTDNKIIDISKKIPGVTTVPVMCMMIALYMGFKNIYLLGVDNDYWKTGEYKYFFEPTALKGKDQCMREDGKPRGPLYEQFLGFGGILKQYWLMRNIALANGANIFNSTEGGALEEFPRVKFESLFLK